MGGETLGLGDGGDVRRQLGQRRLLDRHHVDVLREVVDLSTAAAQASLEITAQELTGDWVGYQSRTPYTRVSEPIGIAPTQELGEALFQTGVEGFRSVSARVPFNRTLVVFTTNLRLGSSVVFADDRGTVQRINGTRA